MENSLLQAEKIAATGRMAATIAHEINNPLEGVVNLLYLAKLKAVDREQMEYLSAAESEVGRVSHIAKQTLGYYRENAAPADASLAGLAADALRIYEPKLRAANIKLQTHFESHREITMRKGEIMQVISNLLANSIYAMSQGGRLTVSVQDVARPRDGVALIVEDTGVGIPEDNLSRVFDAFFSTRTTIGTGIGLFVAKQFVEGHGGSIALESSTDPERHGTKMTIYLPV
jgi:signal transduction histidine kinase